MQEKALKKTITIPNFTIKNRNIYRSIVQQTKDLQLHYMVHKIIYHKANVTLEALVRLGGLDFAFNLNLNAIQIPYT